MTFLKIQLYKKERTKQYTSKNMGSVLQNVFYFVELENKSEFTGCRDPGLDLGFSEGRG